MFWDNFLIHCRKIGKSPSAVAKEIGISTGAVARWKDGSIPQSATLAKIADYFGVSIPHFFKFEAPNQQPAPKRSKEMFIEKLNELMAEKKVTRAQLAAAVGIGRNQIKYWETHGNIPNADVLRRIADYFGVSVPYFLEVPAPDQQSAPKLSELEIQSINKDRDMTPMEAWWIISSNLMELYKCKRTETFKGYTDADLDAEVLCFKALSEMYERSEGK